MDRTTGRGTRAATAVGIAFASALFAAPAVAAPEPADARLASASLKRFAADGAGRLPAEDEQRRLRLHFSVVIDLLNDETGASLDVAVTRLEARSDDRWSPAERHARRAALAAERAVQIERLRAYRDRGRFPLNDGFPSGAVPIFVDRRGTHCAVGHLMQLAGLEAAVQDIAQRDPFVYVPDVQSGPLVEWVLRSGLTQEEAALIQPGYAPPPFDATLAELTAPGAPPVLSQRLRYENFGLAASIHVLPTGPPPGGFPSWQQLCQTIPGFPGCGAVSPLSLDPTQIGVAAGSGIYASEGVSFVPAPGMTDWLFFGSRQVGMVTATDSVVQVAYGFDVSAIDPGALLDMSFLTATPYFNFNVDSDVAGPGGILVTARISDGGQLLATLVGDGTHSSFQFAEFSEGASLDPRSHLRLDVDVVVTGPATFTSLFHEFRVVPEPGSLALAGLGLLGLVAARLRSRRAGG